MHVMKEQIDEQAVKSITIYPLQVSVLIYTLLDKHNNHSHHCTMGGAFSKAICPCPQLCQNTNIHVHVSLWKSFPNNLFTTNSMNPKFLPC